MPDKREDDRLFTQGDVDRIVQDRLARDRQARITSEPRVYGLRSPHSFFNDAACVTTDITGTQFPAAQQRMRQYGVELAHEIEARSDEGRYAESVIRDLSRVEDQAEHRRRFDQRLQELRAIATGGGATASASSGAAAFVSPYFLLTEWALFRGRNRAFADQCHSLPIPDYGMEVYVPAWSSGSGAGQQTEASAVTETDPGAALPGAQVVTITGQITASQQFSDRAGSGAGWSDVVLHRQLAQQLEEQIDIYALTQSITTAGVTTSGSAWAANTLVQFYTDMALAREGITDTAGVRLRPTHLFSTSDFFSFVSHVMGSDGRPMLMPPSLAPQTYPSPNGADGGANSKWSRFTGIVLPGNVLWFEDDNIPASGSNTQVVVSAPDEAVLLLESPDPVFSIFPQMAANQLQIVFNLRSYCALLARHATGTQVITGNGYPTSNK